MEKRTCAVEDCQKDAWARGWCHTHYGRWHRTGSTEIVRRSLADRLWSKVNKSGPTPEHRPELGPCWVWTGSVSGYYGHGEIGAGRRGEGQLKAHRVTWELHNGPIPGTAQVLHHCDNGRCVRPDHLFLGTQAENVHDMVSKGRHRNQNTGKTHCHKGHVLAGENLYVTKSGFRRCKTCHRDRDRRRSRNLLPHT